MIVVSIREQIKSVANRWAESYADQPMLVLRDGRIAGDVLAWLRAMDADTATRDDVAQIIGNYGWVSLVCAECCEQVDAAVSLDSSSDDSSPVYCRRCLQRAASICS
jgi:hypothetical protein